jgi:uncharacterized OB-fold protein
LSIPVHAGLFTEDAYGKVALLGGRCSDCGRYHFPLASRCPYCGSAAVTEVRLSDRGTVWGWTAVTTAPPGYNGPVPFGFGVVELPEGLRVITRFEEPDPDRLAFGMAVELTIVDVGTNDDGDPISTYSFSPISDETAAT